MTKKITAFLCGILTVSLLLVSTPTASASCQNQNQNAMLNNILAMLMNNRNNAGDCGVPGFTGVKGDGTVSLLDLILLSRQSYNPSACANNAACGNCNSLFNCADCDNCQNCNSNCNNCACNDCGDCNCADCNNCNDCNNCGNCADCNNCASNCKPAVPVQTAKPAQTKPVVTVPVQTTKVPSTTIPKTAPTAPAVNETVQEEILRLVNVERAKAGLNPVVADATLNNAAQVRANEIVSSLSHTRPNGTSCFTVLKEMGISYRGCGENIAAGYATAAITVNAWMKSDGHRANIMNPSYTHLGVGYTYIPNSAYRHYYTQMFISK